MISWMQKHKKWLVITIWISTIAFVGAGFVGWGSYSYGKSGGTVATVGSIDINSEDLQKEYSGLYAQYEQMFGKEFNKETADKLKLDQQAYNNLVQKYLILNLAKKYGITATNDEVLAELVKYKTFFKDGKFDKETYIQILAQNKTNPTDFEEGLKKDITFYKTISIFNLSMNDKEMKTLNQIFFSEDKVSINIIDSKNISKDYKPEDLKKYWEANKNNYKSIPTYKIAIQKLQIGTDEKLSKNDALKKYLALKNGKETFTSEEVIDDKNSYFAEHLVAIIGMKNGEIAKPFKINNDFVIVKMITKNLPSPLAFEQAISLVKADFEKSIVKKGLEAKRDTLLKDFQGTSIGYINKDQAPIIPSLNADEIKLLVSDIFASKSAINSSTLGNKIVVFKIDDTKIGNFNNDKNQFLRQSILKIKNDELIISVLEKLKNEYEIKSNMKVE